MAVICKLTRRLRLCRGSQKQVKNAEVSSCARRCWRALGALNGERRR